MKTFIALFAAIPLTLFALPQGIYNGTVVRVIDGDTVEITVDKYIYTSKDGSIKDVDGRSQKARSHSGEVVKLRFSLIDACETSTAIGKACKRYLSNVLNKGDFVVFHVVGGAAFRDASAILWKPGSSFFTDGRGSLNVRITHEQSCTPVQVLTPQQAEAKGFANKNLHGYMQIFYDHLTS